MGTGQTLLTIAAMMMISRMVLSVNNENAQSAAASRWRHTGLRRHLWAHLSSKKQAVLRLTNSRILMVFSNPTSFTPVNKLGPDNGEVYPHYDDFDDFNGLHKIDSLAGSAVFATDVTVQYVSITNNVITVANTQTYNKQITVMVSSKWMPDTLKFYNVMSYWFFR